MPKFAIVDSERINQDVTYEPPLVIAFGVDKHSVGSTTVTMGRTRIPPGGRNQAHYHSCEASFFIRKGSPTETAELVFTYGNCPSKNDAGTVFVEKSWVGEPR
ncbi:MAG: hypothetical protein E6H04_00690 [Bacillati bacterium ANGP1]|uniref:Cupin domain-containing protein n=1 Tax=Candidatus Segetimicrobium genomatis TaxID=2569760 RepID=A0A537JMI2_9BACT|nr:MAG: hypothetical protein E6H04_00690 [Terrabacteria group bacterium ANGP1]